MKKVLTASVLAITSAFCMNASAQTTITGNLNVNVNLTSKCQIWNTTSGLETAVIPDITIAYTSFQTTVTNTKSDFNVRCTNGLTFGIGIDNVTGNVRGINYFATVSSAATPPTLTANGAALTGQVGAPAGTPFYVHTTAPAGQAGNFEAAVAQARVVSVTF